MGKNDESESSRGKWRNFQFFRAILLPCTRTLTNTSSCQIPTKATTHAVSSSSSSPALRLNLKRQFSIANPLFLLISDSSLTYITADTTCGRRSGAATYSFVHHIFNGFLSSLSIIYILPPHQGSLSLCFHFSAMLQSASKENNPLCCGGASAPTFHHWISEDCNDHD